VNRRSIVGLIGGGLTMILLALAPGAQARDSAKFKFLSISGSTTSARDVVYDPSPYGSCSFTQTEHVSFHSTTPITAYAFTSKAHGSARVEWSPKSTFSGNLVQLEMQGEVTVSRSATYQQSVVVDPETGETNYGCYHEVLVDGSPARDCTVEKTLPATLKIGGTSDTQDSTYAYWDVSQRDMNALDAACEVIFTGSGADPRLFSRAELFGKQKRLDDTDRQVWPAFDNTSDDQTVTGEIVNEVSGKLKRKKLRSSERGR
jgi:hypothetical protein